MGIHGAAGCNLLPFKVCANGLRGYVRQTSVSVSRAARVALPERLISIPIVLE